MSLFMFCCPISSKYWLSSKNEPFLLSWPVLKIGDFGDFTDSGERGDCGKITISFLLSLESRSSLYVSSFIEEVVSPILTFSKNRYVLLWESILALARASDISYADLRV